jgi:hypothetical protein
MPAHPRAPYLKKRRATARRLPNAEHVLRGSLVKRFLPCGKPNCICKKQGGHGPYYYLVITTGVGQTRSILIPAEQRAQVAQWLRNYRSFRKGLETISGINVALILQRKRTPRSTP